MKNGKLVITELILIFSSVLVFRSLWTLMDKVPLLNETSAHVLLLIIGLFLTIYSLACLTK